MSDRYPLSRDDLLLLNPNLVRNFLRNVEIPSPSRLDPNPCWLWKGSKSETGYGNIHIKVPGRDGLLKSCRSVPVRAHRVTLQGRCPKPIKGKSLALNVFCFQKQLSKLNLCYRITKKGSFI